MASPRVGSWHPTSTASSTFHTTMSDLQYVPSAPPAGSHVSDTDFDSDSDNPTPKTSIIALNKELKASNTELDAIVSQLKQETERLGVEIRQLKAEVATQQGTLDLWKENMALFIQQAVNKEKRSADTGPESLDKQVQKLQKWIGGWGKSFHELVHGPPVAASADAVPGGDAPAALTDP